jgi:hypothetical protein
MFVTDMTVQKKAKRWIKMLWLLSQNNCITTHHINEVDNQQKLHR